MKKEHKLISYFLRSAGKMKNKKLMTFFIISIYLSGGFLLYGDQIYHLVSSDYRVDMIKDGFHKIVMEGYFSYGIPGYPDLPSKIFQIAVPPEIDLNSIKVYAADSGKINLGSFRIKELPPLATWRNNVKITGRKADVYVNNSFYPEETVEYLGISQMRKWRIVKVKYTPFQYNPITSELRYIPEVTLRIKYSKIGLAPIPNFVLTDEVMDTRAERILLNYQEAKKWYIPSDLTPKPSQTHNYVIITTNSIAASSTQLGNFTSYLSGKGYSPLVITEDDYGILTGQAPNGRAEKIREWLKNNYITYSIEYVLLAGNPDPDDPSISDAFGDVPMKMCWLIRAYSSVKEGIA